MKNLETENAALKLANEELNKQVSYQLELLISQDRQLIEAKEEIHKLKNQLSDLQDSFVQEISAKD